MSKQTKYSSRKSNLKGKQESENKGVTVNFDRFNSTSKSLRDYECFGRDPVSVDNVREELENVIEMMGPTTPHFHQTINSDADNEDSIYSTSVYSSVVKIKTVKKNDHEDQNLLSYCEDSQMTACNISEFEHEIVKTNEVAIQTTDIFYQPMCSSFSLPHNLNYPVVMIPPTFTQNGTKLHISNTRKSFLSKYLGINMGKRTEKKSLELYKVDIQQNPTNESPPKRLVFDLIDNIPKSDTKNVGTNTMKSNHYSNAKRCYQKISNNENRKRCQDIPQHETRIPLNNYDNISYSPYMKKKLKSPNENMDIYYFDHGNSAYYRTTDTLPTIAAEIIAQKTEYYTTKFWAQIFGTLHIGISFITSFILQLIRFILHSIVRPLIIGVIQLISDYFFKPLLAVMFNGIVQPPLIFFYNIATSVRDFIKPISDSVGYFIRELAVLCKSIRCVQIDNCKTCVEAQKTKCDCR